MVVSALRQEDTIDLRTALLALNPAVASVSVKFNVEPGAVVSDIAKAEALLRCAQEGLTNALRHGGATEILVTLSRNDEELVLSVEDNGAGYSSPDTARRERPARIARATGGIPGSRLAGSTHAAGLRPARRIPEPRATC